MNDITIREIEKEEYPDTINLVYDVFSKYEAPNYTKEGAEEFFKTINDEKFISSLKIYGAFVEDDLAGMIATRNNGEHIALFFVDERYQNKGIGRKLFEYILDKTDCEKITVNSSIYARNIYRRLGFNDTDEEKCVNGLRFIPMEFIRNGK